MAETPDRSESMEPSGLWGLLQKCFGVSNRVNSRTYWIVGLTLMLLKYAVEYGLILAYTGHQLLPWQFFTPIFSERLRALQDGPEWLGWFVFVWTLPFVWVAFSMSVRRAADAGLTPWAGMLVLVPVFNLLVMVCLAAIPTDPNAGWEVGSTSGVPAEAVALVGNRALIAVSSGLLLGLLMLGISVYWMNDYGEALFFATPLAMGACTGFLCNRPVSRSWGTTLQLSLVMIVAAAAVLLCFALEGAICIVMAAPAVLPLTIMGAFLGKAIANATPASTRQTLSMLLLVPLLTGVASHWQPTPEYVVLTSIDIKAPPEVVWRNVIEFPDLPEPDEWYFRAGIACPMRARIEGEGVGAVRHCEFTTGDFVEPITVWEAPRRLAFDVREQPDPVFELSPYRHLHPPHMEHSTFRSQRGEFLLIPLPGGRTRLEGRTWYTFQMRPQNYWTLWSQMGIHRIHRRVLEHIREISEASAQVGAAAVESSKLK